MFAINRVTNVWVGLLMSCIVCCIVGQLYLNYKYGFWYYQPVIHSYDLFRMMCSPQVINPGLPLHSDSGPRRFFMGSSIIRTMRDDSLEQRQRAHFVALISDYYLKNKDGNVYSPGSNGLWPYFVGHDHTCFFSFYYNPTYYNCVASGAIIEDAVPIGTICSRPLKITFCSGGGDVLEVYYVEFLCVKDEYRRKGIAPKLIQTHEFNQRHGNKQIAVSLFKHEDKILQGIVPLTVYTTYGFPIKYWMRGGAPPPLDGRYKMLAITPQTMPDLIDFMAAQRACGAYSVFIESAIANVLELIKTNNIFIHAVLDNESHKVVAAYFYRHSYVRLEEGAGPILTLFGSLYDAEACEDALFMAGFKQSFYAIAKKWGFDFCAIENISKNGELIQGIRQHTEPTIKSPCAWFFYNYIYGSVASDKVFILY